MIAFGMNWFVCAFNILFQLYPFFSAFFSSIVALHGQQNIALETQINLFNLFSKGRSSGTHETVLYVSCNTRVNQFVFNS